MASKISFLEATVIRRSTVTLKDESPISDSRIVEIVKHAVLHSPSPFHVQSCRTVILLHNDHKKLWDLAYKLYEPTTPPPLWARLGPNLKSFGASYGTVLFFEDPTAVDAQPPPLANLIKSFPEWAEHSNGMAQYIAWTALCAEGLGANLQHLQKVISEQVAQDWNLPSHWIMRAQLVFGAPDGPPRGGVEKTFADIEPRVRVFGEK